MAVSEFLLRRGDFFLRRQEDGRYRSSFMHDHKEKLMGIHDSFDAAYKYLQAGERAMLEWRYRAARPGFSYTPDELGELDVWVEGRRRVL